MFFTIYKTTNMKNNKFYIGMHKTNNLEDDYLGSGTILRRSIKYHGKENFKKKILHVFGFRNEMVQKEIEIVNEELLKDPLCMNLMEGGKGGKNEGGFKKGNKHWVTGAKKGAEGLKKRIKNDPVFLHKLQEALKKRRNKGIGDWTGKKHSKETKKKMSLSQQGKQKGSNNSQYGTCWITNEKENKKIFKGDNILNGWRLGRKMKF